MRRTLVLALTLVTLALLMQACGTRGPLYLPPPDADGTEDARKKEP
jgi:predicted small lipoprotein YifL